MNETRPKTFQYIKFKHEGNQYFCVQQPLWMLTWILFFKKTILRPINRNHPRTPLLKIVLNWLRGYSGFFKKNIRILVHFVFYRKQPSALDFLLQLPCFGHLCVTVHRGKKIFDLRRAAVIKVFDHDVPPSAIVSEIELVQHISQIDFAPSIRKWNIEERWYEEDYLPGSPDGSATPMDTETLITTFHHDVIHKLNALILLQEPKVRNVITYVTDITKILYSSRLSKQESTISEFKRITQFVHFIIGQLRMIHDGSIFLVFTHGDFLPANMLNTPHGLNVIDWEHAGYRSVLFDFYSYFFYRSANRAVPVNTMRSELQMAYPLLMTELANKARSVSRSVRRAENVYRWLFYIEMLCKLVERETSDKNLDVMKFISQYLQTFIAYEELLGLNDVRTYVKLPINRSKRQLSCCPSRLH